MPYPQLAVLMMLKHSLIISDLEQGSHTDFDSQKHKVNFIYLFERILKGLFLLQQRQLAAEIYGQDI